MEKYQGQGQSELIEDERIHNEYRRTETSTMVLQV